MIKNVFDQQEAAALVTRIHQIQPGTKPLWGKMNAGQMMAHCCVTYEFVYDNKHPKPAGLKKLMIQLFAKNIVVGPKPYKRNERTAPEFIMPDNKNFNQERERLSAYVQRTQELGAAYFEGRESHAFGKLSTAQWNTMFYKHLDHHLQQFGV
jgi:hypothetical protein